MTKPCTTACPPVPASGVFRLALAALLTMQAMVVGLAVNLTPPDDAPTLRVLQSLVLLLSGVVVALLGGPLLHSAWLELRRGRLTVELLFLSTAAGAFGASLQSYFSGDGPIYFEVIGVLLVVYSFGRLILERQRTAAVSAADAWAAALSQARLTDGRSIVVTEVRPGDVVEVRPGELIPVDGVVREGVGFVAEAAVSGEPFAVVRRPGDRVLAGSASTDAVLQIEATAAGTERQVDWLIAAVEAAKSRPGSLTRQADRLTRLFLPILLAVALLTFAGWALADGWRAGLFNAMSVLLVACPCALGLATPLAVWSALADLAKRGLLSRRGDVVERLASIDRIIFDKTGTLTDDSLELIDVVTHGNGVERRKLLGWLALVESKCQHPVARAFATSHGTMIDPSARVLELRTVPGQGVEATIEAGGAAHALRVGRGEWLDSENRPEAAPLLAALRARDGHRIDVELDGRIAAVAVLSERLRNSAADAVARLEAMRLPVEIWTGDRAERAQALFHPSPPALRGRGDGGDTLVSTAAGGEPPVAGYSTLSPPSPLPPQSRGERGVSVFGSLLPEDKRRLLADIVAAGGRPLFVGDGLNDAGALAVAHAGIALASGNELANEAAHLTLRHGDLRAIPEAIERSRAAVAVMRRVLGRAAAYNVVGVALAAAGLLHPVAAALLMVASSLLAAWSAGRACHADDPERADDYSRASLNVRALAHAVAFALQGIVWIGLLGLGDRAGVILTAIFGLIGVASAIGWRRWRSIPHHADMIVGMLTLGNLGMLLGWWADWEFGPLPECGCACSLQHALARPWMWLGMLAGGNVAMALLARRPHPTFPGFRAAMFGGGNVGMVAGMAAGMAIAPAGPVGHFLGMTVGMMLGMGLGHELTLELLSARAGSRSAEARRDGHFVQVT